METFTPIASLMGGIIVGLASVAFMLFNGRILGISGIVGGLVDLPEAQERNWRLLFVLGLVVGGLAFWTVQPSAFEMTVERSPLALIAAGLLVGFGTRLGSGCTSGHGICGISRFSKRSLVSVLTFMAAGAITVFIVNHVLGGSL